MDIVDDTQPDLNDNTVFLNIPGKAARTVKPGDILGDNYRLIDLIGRGGMGVVYRCRHLIIEQDYALKLLSPDQVNEQSWQRFQVEGQAIAKLDHPNIVKIFNMGVHGQDCPFYVMELLPGESLETCIESHGPLSPEEALDIFSQLASGLSYAHSRGIVHRDIKPSNIIIQKDSSGKNLIKIVDFGLAKLVDRHNLASQSLTSQGEVIGSPFYMSPEQGLGTEVDARSDIYSLGCTLFKTLTGKPPFCGESAFQTIMMHQSQPAPSLDSATAAATNEIVFPPALEDLVHKMLAKRPDERYQSMEQLSHDISRLQRGKTLAKTGQKEQGNNFSNSNDGLHRTTKQPALKNNRLLFTALSLITFAVVCLSIRLQGDRTRSSAKTGPPLPGPVGLSTANQPVSSAELKPDPEMEAGRASFNRFKRLDTELIHNNGHPFLRFHFPTWAIGTISYDNGIDWPQQFAQGTIDIPYCHTIALSIEINSNSCTWANPEILRKIDSRYINNLNISYDDENSAAKPFSDIIDQVSHWKDLSSLNIAGSTVTPQILRAVEKLPDLRNFANTHTKVKSSVMSTYRLLGTLKGLELCQVDDAEIIFLAMKSSKNLLRLSLDSTNLSTKAIETLRGFANLEDLRLERTSLSKAELVALSQIPQLKQLMMTRLTLDQPLDLIQAKALHHLDRLVIRHSPWTALQSTLVKKAFPKADIGDERAKNEY